MTQSDPPPGPIQQAVEAAEPKTMNALRVIAAATGSGAAVMGVLLGMQLSELKVQHDEDVTRATMERRNLDERVSAVELRDCLEEAVRLDRDPRTCAPSARGGLVP